MHADQQILSAILFHSDGIVILIFFIEVIVFINYTAFRLFGDIFEIDKKNMYYGIGFVSTGSISVFLLHLIGRYYLNTLPASLLIFIFCVSSIVLFYYTCAGMGTKRKCTGRQNENLLKESYISDETLPGQITKENDQKKKRDLAVKVTGIFLMAASFFELMMNLSPYLGIPMKPTGSAIDINFFPIMSMLLLVYTIAAAHWKYSGYVFLTPRMLAWITYFLSFIPIVFLFFAYPARLL